MQINDLINARRGHYLIAGCGPSVTNISLVPSNHYVFGVNDVARFGVELDFHIVIDQPKQFGDRMAIIEHTGSDILFTQRKDVVTSSDDVCMLDLKRERKFQIFDGEVCVSNNSPFVAANIALLMGAESITFAGVDIVGHPNFSDKMIQQARLHYCEFTQHANSRGIEVFNLGTDNVLSGIDGVYGSADYATRFNV